MGGTLALPTFAGSASASVVQNPRPCIRNRAFLVIGCFVLSSGFDIEMFSTMFRSGQFSSMTLR